jgi:phage protein D
VLKATGLVEPLAKAKATESMELLMQGFGSGIYDCKNITIAKATDSDRRSN